MIVEIPTKIPTPIANAFKEMIPIVKKYVDKAAQVKDGKSR
jgi:hypothetical protein